MLHKSQIDNCLKQDSEPWLSARGGNLVGLSAKWVALCFAALCLASFYSSTARGDNFQWSSPGGDYWDNPNAWTATPRTSPYPGFLTPTDTVGFAGIPGPLLTYVEVDVSPTVSAATVATGNFQFDFGDLSGNPTSLTVTGANQFIVGSGAAGNATLTIDADFCGFSGGINSNGVSIGDTTGSYGTVNINASAANMASAYLTDTKQIVVGNNGNGTLNLTGGATATTSGDVNVALNLNSVGAVKVDGAGSKLTGNNVYVGGVGSGSMTVSNGGVATATTHFAIGSATGDSATVTVSGTGSQVVGQGWMDVGQYGQGTLNVNQNGYAAAPSIFIGGNSGAAGFINVGGTNAQVQTGWLVVGSSGATGSVTINSGGTATSSGAVTLGYLASTTGIVTVNNGGTLNGDRFSVGYQGQGTFNVNAGGTTTSNYVGIGDAVGGVGFATVSGAAASMNVAGGIDVGNQGQGTLTVSDGGNVAAMNSFTIGSQSGGTGNVTVGGSGAAANISGVWGITDGYNGTGTLTINSGGTATTPFSAYIGSQATANGTLNVNAGGTLNAVEAIFIGNEQGSIGHATIGGTGALMKAGWYVNVGSAGQGHLTVNAGGTAHALNAISIGATSTGVGTIDVGGSNNAAGTVQADWGLIVGDAGQGTLNVNSYATANVGNGFTVANSVGGSGQATVSGSGASLQVAWGMDIGYQGIGSLTINNGGSAAAQDALFIGDTATGAGTVTVGGIGSSSLSAVWDITLGNLTGSQGTLKVDAGGSVTTPGPLSVGYSGTGNITVTNGGYLSAQSVTAGQVANGVGTITVGGGNGVSQLSSGSYVVLGNVAGTSGTLNVDAGGNVSAQNFVSVGYVDTGALHLTAGGTVSTMTTFSVADAANSTGTVTVDGAGTSLQSASWMDIGNYGTGSMSITNGGSVSTQQFLTIGDNPGSVGSVTVGGNHNTGTSSLSSGSYLILGSKTGSSGTLTVGNGGSVTSQGYFSVGHVNSGALYLSGSGTASTQSTFSVADVANSKGTVTVDGAGTTLQSASWMDIGNYGAGTMIITNGGSVSTQQSLTIGDNSTSVGIVSVGGVNNLGTSSLSASSYLILGNNTGSSGTLNIGTGGRVTAGDFVSVGYASNGALHLNGGGTLTTQSTFSVADAANSVASVTLDGAGTALQSASWMAVGNSGTGTMTITNGASVTSTYTPDQSVAAFLIGGDTTANGHVTVDGAGSTLQTQVGGLFVANLGPGTLDIKNGGTVSTQEMAIGAAVGGATGTVTLDGATSSINVFSLPQGGPNQGVMIVGNRAGGTLTMTGGSTVTSPVTHVGEYAGSVGQLTVSSGATYHATQYLNVGTGYNPNTNVNTGLSVGGVGTLTINSGSSATVGTQLLTGDHGTIDLTGGGTIKVGNTGSTSVSSGGLLIGSGGILAGSGTILANVSSAGGTLTPGLISTFGSTLPAAGTLTFGSNLVTSNLPLDRASTTNYMLAAPGTIGSGVNSLTEVHGNLTLSGALDVTGLAGFGTGIYRLFDYTGSLTVNAFSLAALPSGFAADIDTTTAGQVNLDVQKVGTIPGDVNGDGIVNIADLTLVGSNWLGTGKYAIGDANNDHIVNIADLTLIGSNWLSTGTGTSLDLAQGAATPVPEPSSMILGVMAAGTLVVVRRGRVGIRR